MISNFLRALAGSALWWISAFTVLAFSLLLWRPPGLADLDPPVFDRYWAGYHVPPPVEKIVVVLATERSMRAFEQWPWPRRVHAELLARLGLAKVVAMDILFPERSNEIDDQWLARVAGEMGNVVLACHLTPEDDGRWTVALPYPALLEAAAGLGVVNVQPEADGLYRDSTLIWPYHGQALPSLPFAALLATGRNPALTESPSGYTLDLPSGPFHLDRQRSFTVHHPAREVPIYEYVDVHEGLVPAETFQDAVVFVGVSATGAEDYFAVGLGRILPGTVYNAHALATVLSGVAPRQAPDWAGALAGALLTLAGSVMALKAPVKRGGAWFALLLAAWLGLASWIFFRQAYWLPLASTTATALVFYFAGVYVRLTQLSHDWAMRELSIDSLLLLGGGSTGLEKADFAEYLARSWPAVAERTGLSLVAAQAPADDPLVEACFAKHSVDRTSLSENLLMILNGADQPPRHRLLVPLPAREDGRRDYTVLAWDGRPDLDTLKSGAAIVLSAAMYFRAIEEGRARRELFLNVIRALIGAIDAKDPTTAGHSERVAALGRELARKMDLSEDIVGEVYLAGILHDVGKIGIPDQILHKPGRLDDEELASMRRHPRIAAKLLAPIRLPESVMKGIVEHHERQDGRGYPEGKDSAAISLVGRILQVADVFDALASRRQYKDPWPLDKVYDLLRSGAGGEFDNTVVTALLARPFEIFAKKPSEKTDEAVLQSDESLDWPYLTAAAQDK